MRRFAMLASIFVLLGAAASAQVTWGNGSFPPPFPASNWYYVNNVGFDLLGYARDEASLHGGIRSTTTVFLTANNAYGWKMRYFRVATGTWVTTGFNMVAVAQWQGYRNGLNSNGNTLKNWGVYFTDFNNPYSWKGAYWITWH